jgi:hypothetical protein
MLTKVGTDKTQWYTVFNDKTYKEYFTKEDALKECSKNGLFIVEDIFRDFCKADYWWKISNFKFYDKNGKEILVSVGSWKIVEINEIYRKSNRFEVEFTFQDPQKEIKRHKFSDKSQGSLRFCKLFEAIDYLKEREKFSSWKEYSLYKENQKLKSELEELKLIINQNNKKI